MSAKLNNLICCLKTEVKKLTSKVNSLTNHSHTADPVTIVEYKTFYVTVWAEQNGNIVTNRWNYSFGNGNEANGNGTAGQPGDWGYVTHFPWELVSMSLGSRTTNTADTETELTVNGATVGQSVLIPGSQTKAVDNTVTHAGPAGDVLNFRTLQVGGGNDVVVSCIIKYTLP